MPAIVFSFDEIVSVFSTSSVYIELINEIEKGFINYSNNKVYVAPIIHLGCSSANSIIPQMIGCGDVCVKSGYIVHDKYYVVKIAGVGFQNQSNSGTMLVFSQLSGALNGILLDNGILTELRTAAAGALAAKYFAPKQITNIGIVGTGVQARAQLNMLQYVIPYAFKNKDIKVYVYGRSSQKCEKYKNDMSAMGIKCVEIAANMSDIGKNCNLIVMCTRARRPLLLKTHLNGNKSITEHGMHINCIGADGHGKQELDDEIVSQCMDLVIVDSKSQCVEVGEVQHAVKNKSIPMYKVMEFGEVLNGSNLHKFQRQNDNDARVTMFDSTGVAIQDVVISKMVYQTLQKSKNN